MPTPASGDSYYFEYQSKNWCTDSTGATKQSAFAADADVALLDEDLLTDGLVWRFKHAKGLEYAEDFATYQRDVTNAITRDTERPSLNMGRTDSSPTGVVIPIGNWECCVRRARFSARLGRKQNRN